MKRPPVIIIGAHRSGTSATAHALELLGLQIGQRLDSHFEPRALQSAHENYLRKSSAAWYEPHVFLEKIAAPEAHADCVAYLRALADSELVSMLGYAKRRRFWSKTEMLESENAWGWKEPRTTLFARCWLEIFPEARFIHAVRHPLAAASSIRERELQFENGPRDERLRDLAFCLQLVLQYIEAGEALSEHAKYFQRVRFEDLQADPIGKLKALGEFSELDFDAQQLMDAASTIRPTVSSPAPPFFEQTYLDLISKYPRAARLGYGWPASSSKSVA